MDYQTGVDLLLANAITITGTLDHSSGPLSSAIVSEREWMSDSVLIYFATIPDAFANGHCYKPATSSVDIKLLNCNQVLAQETTDGMNASILYTTIIMLFSPAR